MHGVIGKDSLQYIVQIIASLVARQAAMAVQDTQITVFHESAAQGGGEWGLSGGSYSFSFALCRARSLRCRQSVWLAVNGKIWIATTGQ